MQYDTDSTIPSKNCIEPKQQCNMNNKYIIDIKNILLKIILNISFEYKMIFILYEQLDMYKRNI